MSYSNKPSQFLQRAPALVALCLCALATSGCGSKATRVGDTADSSPTTQTRTREGWFCQVGENNDEWDCVKGSERQAPTRLPEPRSGGSSRLAAADPAAAVPAPSTPRPAPSAATAPASAAETQPPTPPAARQPLPAALPRHVELSYRPSKAVAILDLPADFHAVQLVAVSSKEALEAYAREHKLSGMSAARIYAAQKMYYVLLLGIYETRENAELAIESLSGPLAGLNPWIRSVGSLQRAMLEADRVSGSEDY